MAIALTKYGKTKQYDKPLVAKPASVQDIWPVKSIDETGVFTLGEDMYSKCFILTDLNFAGVTDTEQKEIIVNFSHVLNTMSCRFSYRINAPHEDYLFVKRTHS